MSKASGAFVAALYVVLGLADLWLSLAAFQLGVVEGNPFLAWMSAQGFFVPAKLALTALVAALIVALYRRERAQPLCWSALVLMALVDLYHVVGLRAQLQAG